MDAVAEAEWGFAPSVEEKLPKLLTAPELAEKFDSISRDRLYELARDGLIPHVKIGRSVRFSARAISAWIENGGTTGPAAAE